MVCFGTDFMCNWWGMNRLFSGFTEWNRVSVSVNLLWCKDLVFLFGKRGHSVGVLYVCDQVIKLNVDHVSKSGFF